MKQGERTDIEPSANLQKVSRADAAQLLSTSERTVNHAKVVLENATPAIISAVDSGKLSVSTAATIARLEPERQLAQLKQNRPVTVEANLPQRLEEEVDEEEYLDDEFEEDAPKTLVANLPQVLEEEIEVREYDEYKTCKESYNALRLHGVKGTYKEYLITGVNSMHCSNLTIQNCQPRAPKKLRFCNIPRGSHSL